MISNGLHEDYHLDYNTLYQGPLNYLRVRARVVSDQHFDKVIVFCDEGGECGELDCVEDDIYEGEVRLSEQVCNSYFDIKIVQSEYTKSLFTKEPVVNTEVLSSKILPSVDYYKHKGVIQEKDELIIQKDRQIDTMLDEIERLKIKLNEYHECIQIQKQLINELDSNNQYSLKSTQ